MRYNYSALLAVLVIWICMVTSTGGTGGASKLQKQGRLQTNDEWKQDFLKKFEAILDETAEGDSSHVNSNTNTNHNHNYNNNNNNNNNNDIDDGSQFSSYLETNHKVNSTVASNTTAPGASKQAANGASSTTSGGAGTGTGSSNLESGDGSSVSIAVNIGDDKKGEAGLPVASPTAPATALVPGTVVPLAVSTTAAPSPMGASSTTQATVPPVRTVTAPAPSPINPMLAQTIVATNAGKAAATAMNNTSEFGRCKTCVFVLERIKRGSTMLLPAICTELYAQYPTDFGLCHQVLDSMSMNGDNIRYWLMEGCYKYEIYNTKEWIKPCPSHVICSVMTGLDSMPFCPSMEMENPFVLEQQGGGTKAVEGK